MAADNTLDTAEGWSKEVYGEAKDLRPDKVTLQNYTKFSQKDKLGDSFVEVVWLSDEAGLTYDAGTTGDAYALNDSVAGESQKASGQGSEMTLVSRVSIKRLTTAVKSGRAAFGSFYSKLLQNMKNTMGKRLDLTLFYGGDNIGVVSSTSGSAGARGIVLTAGSWIPAAWLGSKGAKIDIYDTTGATKRNSTTDVVITSVVPGTRTINVTGLEAELAAVTATDIFYFKGSKGQQCTGLSTIAGLTTGESYLGINVNDYPDLWAGNAYAVGSAALTFAKIQDALMQAAARGGEGDHLLFISHATWASLADDMDALRAIDSSYSSSETKQGTQKISFFTGTGKVTVVPSLYVKQGEAFAIPRNAFTRRGSSDIDFNVPGMGESYFRILDGYNGVELRCYSDQMLWGTDLPSCVHFTGITN